MAENPLARILIVEDDTAVATLLQRQLRRAGYEVLLAGSAEEAVPLLEAGGVELLLLDYFLPGGATGLDFYQQLKDAGLDLPVIVVTGLSDEATVIRALRAGARDFVTKSLEYLDYLPEAVARVLHQVRTERRLVESETRYRSLVETAGVVIVSLSPERRIREWNREAEHLFGWLRHEALGQDYFALCLPLESQATVAASLATVLAGEPSHGTEGPVHTREGRLRHLLWNMTPWRNGAGRVAECIVIGVDVTDQKHLEAQLQQAQRMEAVGVLAGGVAHDFNNLLTVITGYSELFLQRLLPDDPGYALIREVRRAGEKAASLTRQLLAFSRKQVMQPVVLDLNSLVTDMEKMLRRLIGEDVDLYTSLDPHLGQIRADPGQLDQVLMNLLVNARDAMPTGGKLTLETRNVELDEAYALEHMEVSPGPYVLLTVTDTGSGMDRETMAHIFEPFFTTKGVGKGTGLGLSTVYGIVKQSGGHINVYSEVGQGTAFKIYLPRLHKSDPAVKSGSGFFKIPKGTETILVVEDEEGVRSLATLALQTHGYTALPARDGDEALRLAQEHAGTIDLVLTDVVMPRMSGPQLTAKLAALWTGLKVIYMSGYTNDAIVRHGILESGVVFLQKPFTPTVLLKKVREVLDR